MEAKKTPLYEEHIKLGCQIADFAGWLMPIQYEGLIPEHNAVRNEAGLFDVSHMGVIKVTGKDAEAYLDFLLTNDISKAKDKQIVYTFMCHPHGGVVDDFLVYKSTTEEYLLVVNAVNLQKDYKWLKEQKKDYDVVIEDESPQTGILALQGPKAVDILQKLTDFDLSNLKTFFFEKNVKVAGFDALVSRNGYTGEDGFEIYTDHEGVVKIWKDLLEAGKELGLKPAGLGCRDTLRFEAMLPLYGQEISDDINPLEGGLKFFVKFKKDSDFIGKEELMKIWDAGLKKKMVGFEMTGRGIPRAGYEVQKNGKTIGHVTTGYMSPTLNKRIGNAIIDAEEIELGNEIDIMIRNKPSKAFVRDRNFLKNK